MQLVKKKKKLVKKKKNLDEFKLQMNTSKVLKLTLNDEGNIELLGGEVLLAGDGTLSIRKLRVVQDYSIGSGKILAGQTKVVINTQAVTEKSKFFINPTSDSNNQVLYVSDIKVGESFTVNIKEPLEKDITFDWFIVDSWLSNVKGIQKSEELPVEPEVTTPIPEEIPTEEETTTPVDEVIEETPTVETPIEEIPITPDPQDEIPTSQTPVELPV